MRKFETTRDRGFTLVELMIVIAIVGIMSAIAIPTFLRYIKASKVSEAESSMKKMAEGAKSYYIGEQRYSLDIASGGDQPWHPANPTTGEDDSVGMPVPYSEHTFPGGDGAALCSVGGFGATCTAAEAPDGGSKTPPRMTVDFPIGSPGLPMLNKLKITYEDSMYFAYGFETAGFGTDATATVTAMADFNPTDGALVHTISARIGVSAASRDVSISPAATTNEFE